MGSNMGGELTYRPKWYPIGFDPQPNGRKRKQVSSPYMKRPCGGLFRQELRGDLAGERLAARHQGLPEANLATAGDLNAQTGWDGQDADPRFPGPPGTLVVYSYAGILCKKTFSLSALTNPDIVGFFSERHLTGPGYSRNAASSSPHAFAAPRPGGGRGTDGFDDVSWSRPRSTARLCSSLARTWRPPGIRDLWSHQRNSSKYDSSRFA